MKHLLGYVIWNKAKMLEWIIDGILYSFNPKEVDLLFVLDSPQDGTDEVLLEMAIQGKLYPFAYNIKIFHDETFKFPCQNWMMRYCRENNYKSLIAPQDDQKIVDKSLIYNIENLYFVYRETLGMVGLRDGFEFGYQGMISSEWSESNFAKRRLSCGEFEMRPLLNDGPLIYFNHVIKKIGYHDVENYKKFYIEDDYTARAHYTYGLVNIVMGNNLVHDRTMSSVASKHYDDNAGEEDLKTFNARWRP